MSELKPCPFCGGEAILESNKLRYGTIYSAYCQKCGAEITGFSEHEAIAAWNRRARPENKPLTIDELRGMVGEWVWVEHMDSPASQAAPGEWLKLKTCEPTRLDPYIRFEGKGLCALYYGQSWLAYRRKPRKENEA